MQISNLNSGTGATNVIPGILKFDLNVRYSPSTTVEKIKSDIEDILINHEINYEISWELGGKPFLTTKQELINAVEESIKEITGISSLSSTDGGTSDGRFIAPTGAEVVELGPGNASIHKVNESVKKEDLDLLSQIYTAVLFKLLT